jgi:DNA-binding transcriptional LysR family regulator
MKLLQLRYFYTVCKYLNITRAAEELYVSQPAISAAIRELERDLGLQLFLRHNNRLYLTQEGQILQERASQILREVAQIKNALSEKTVFQKDIFLGLPPILYAYFFPFLLEVRKRFNSKYPAIKLHLHEVPLSQIEGNLRDGLLDFAIAHIDSQSFPSLDKEEIYSSSVMLCLRKDHPLATRESILINDYAGERILTCFNGAAVVTRAIDAWYAEQSHDSKPLSAFQQSQAVEALLLSSSAVALLCPEICMFTFRIAGIPLQKPLRLTFGLIWNSERPVSSAMINVLNELRSMDYYKENVQPDKQ